MEVLVCIKQVPGCSIPTDASGNLCREQGTARLNPRDGYALEAALSLAEGGQVTALTMGPPSAEAVLKTAFSMGVHRGVLLTDRAFAGADVYATAYTLSQGIRALGVFDVIVCGQQSTDGDTAQLPFSLGMQLGIPTIGWIKKLSCEDGVITALQELSGGTQRAVLTGPCVLAVGEGMGPPRIPSLRSQLRARGKKPEILSLSDLPDQNPAHYGLTASPTRVVRVRELGQEKKHAAMPLSGKAALSCLRSLAGEVQGHA